MMPRNGDIGSYKRPRNAPPPRWSPPSRFLLESLSLIDIPAGEIAVDFGCGYGRNSLAVASRGWHTIAMDIDNRALNALAKHYQDNLSAFSGKIWPVRADLSQPPPLEPRSISLGLLIDYVPEIDLPAIVECLRPEGYLLLETFGNRGENWRQLPRLGELRARLPAGLTFLEYQERPCGDPSDWRCAVKMLARMPPAGALCSNAGKRR
jgi:SAM-dependent methyltransferase